MLQNVLLEELRWINTREQVYEMDTFFTGFIFGIIVSISCYIFIWTVRRGKGNSSDSIKGRIDRNNLDTGHGLEKLKEINRETERLNREAGDTAREGLEAIDNTNKSVSEIIATASRTGKEESEG